MTDTGYIKPIRDDGKVNKKMAGTAMCLSSILLFLFPVCSFIATLGVQLCIPFLTNAFIKLMLFVGMSRMEAISLSKYLFSSGAFYVFLDIVITLLSLVLPAYIFSKCVKMDSGDTFPWQGKFVKGFFRIYCAMQIIVLFAGVVSTDIYEFLIPDSKIHPDGFTDFSGVEFDGFMLVMRFIQICVFVPFVEEYVFRGVVFGYLKRYGVMYGVFASAVVFGIAHSGPSQSVYAFVFGVFSAFLVALTGSVKTSILFHALNNITSVLSEQLLAYADGTTVYLFNSIYNIVTLFVGFFGLYLLAKKGGICDNFREKCVQAYDGSENAAGMKQIFVLPVLFFMLVYVVRILLTAV